MRKARVQSIKIEASSEGRFVVEIYEDGSVVRKAITEGGKPRRKTRKPFARVWRRSDGALSD